MAHTRPVHPELQKRRARKFMFLQCEGSKGRTQEDMIGPSRRHIMLDYLHCRQSCSGTNTAVAHISAPRVVVRFSLEPNKSRANKKAPTLVEQGQAVQNVLGMVSTGATLRSSQHRIHLQDMFCARFFPDAFSLTPDIFYPDGTSGGSRTEARSQSTIKSKDVRLGRACEAALRMSSDALITLLAGTSNCESTWLHGAIQLYGHALQQVRLSLQDKMLASQLSNVTRAVYLLLKFETMVSTDFDSAACQAHAFALENLLYRMRSHGTVASAVMSAGLSWLWGMQSLYTLGYGLLRRRTVTGTISPEIGCWNGEDLEYSLEEALLQVPSVLERLDSCRMEYGESIFRELDAILRFRARLHEKFVTENREPNFYDVDFSRYLVYLPDAVRENKHTCSLFPKVYHFNSVSASLLHRQYWTSAMVLDESLDGVTRKISTRRISFRSLHKAFAHHLCKSLPYFATSMRESGRLALLEPLYFLKQHFTQRSEMMSFGHTEMEDMLAWCLAWESAALPGVQIAKALQSNA